jgi:hypothetical protein
MTNTGNRRRYPERNLKREQGGWHYRQNRSRSVAHCAQPGSEGRSKGRGYIKEGSHTIKEGTMEGRKDGRIEQKERGVEGRKQRTKKGRKGKITLKGHLPH